MASDALPAEIEDIYSQFARPYVGRLLKLLKLDKTYVRAEGDRLYAVDPGEGQRDEREVWDFVGGYGSTLLGHNHPVLVEFLKDLLDRKVAFHAQASVRAQTALLARRLSDLVRAENHDPREFVTTLCNSGAEAAEAALKHALMEWNEKKQAVLYELRKRKVSAESEGLNTEALASSLSAVQAATPLIVAVQGSFHGKTAAAVSMTSNESFKAMYATAPVEVRFVSSENLSADFLKILGEADLALPDLAIADRTLFSAIAGFIYEPIQGEGGIRSLMTAALSEVAEQAQRRRIPLIADEIQTGLYRTGTLLASTHLGLKPDYILFGKGLGGGLCKISALLVARERYQEEFGFLHTSTFAEDDVSSALALKTLDLMAAHGSEIRERARTFEQKIRSGVERLRTAYPGVIRDVRGTGFLLGVEFDFTDTASVPKFVNAIYQAGFASYVYASYLLNRHGLRVGVTLSKPDTLRLEPSAWIPDDAVDGLLRAFEDLISLVHERRIIALTAHFWRQEFTPAQLKTTSIAQPEPTETSPAARKIAFLVHVIDDDHFRAIDPLFKNLEPSERARFMKKFGPVTGPIRFHERLLRGANGAEVLFSCYGVFLPSTYFEDSLRRGDGQAFRQVEALFSQAQRDGNTFIGLGQFTSIVSENGLLLSHLGTPLTTGNGLTAGFGFLGLKKALEEKGRSLGDVRVGILGAAGNICNVIAQLAGDEAQAMTLVFREDVSVSAKSADAVRRILKHTRQTPQTLKTTSSLSDLVDCDAIVIGTNSAQELLRPEHVKQDAVVLDLSVPSNVSQRFLSERPDVRCLQSGMAKLPLDQQLGTRWIPTVRGEVFACMGETIVAGLLGTEASLSMGTLTKEHVLHVLEMADSVGVTLGSLRRVRAQ